MTALKVRRIRFDFRDPVPFLWNPQNPALSVGGNVLSIMAIGFERFIVSVVRQAMPLISDPAVVAEADAFLRQEAQHSSAHQQHVRSLVRSYPGLSGTLDAVIADYRKLDETTALPFKLAYIADIEATFTPAFTLLLDHEQTLFRPGDDRIASMFLWHFVEEIEHRSSALRIYDAVVPSKALRLRALPAVVSHLAQQTQLVTTGFEAHVPAVDRMGSVRSSRRLRRKAPALLGSVPLRDKLAAIRGICAAQIPGHEPEFERLPEFADKWFVRYERGEDVVRWYWSERDGS
ncbi:MAG: metal-dependent hydrolase [Mycolicibacterium neoaurum]|uniref:metal-dependent hydrolase n=1 Tax=Mycolicibacterium neoaurum TaxID=1795 RepID=UPI002FF70E87